MITLNILRMILVLGLGGALCSAAEKKSAAEKPEAPATDQSPPVPVFPAGVPGGQVKPAPFSAEISADFMKKVMETSARIEECKQQIAARQAHLFESDPQIKACRLELIEMQMKINAILETDQELARLRLNRDILWTTMPVLPKLPGQKMPFPGGKRGK